MKKGFILFLVLWLLTATALAADLSAVGQTVGIRLQEEGVTITGFTENGSAAASGLKAGDRILRINGTEVSTAAEIGGLIGSGGPVAVTVERDGREAEYLLQPVQSEGRWLLGLRIRDSVAGIGTLTFYDPESGAYGALGHGVTAPEGGGLLSLAGGELIPSSVAGVERGKRGAAGRLLGEFDPSVRLGTVEKNTGCGIFGTMAAGRELGVGCEAAVRGEIHTGPAVIRSNVSGTEVQEYDVQILKIYPNEPERNLLLEVTDPALLAQTGGIVQGMSGSPILQDGKLVGAVTHVLVGDPSKGYGIFLDNMLAAAA